MNRENRRANGAIIRIVLWSVVALVLIVFLCCALWRGGFLEKLNIPSFSFGNLLSYENASAYQTGSSAVPGEGITDIEVNWVDGAVNISVWDGDEIQFSEGNDLPEKQQLRYLVDGSRLIIQYGKPGWSFGRTNRQQKHLQLLIPEEVALHLKLLSVETTSASVTISDVQTDSIRCTTVSGGLQLQEIYAAYTCLETVSGDITGAELAAENLTAETVSGQLVLDGALQEVDLSSVSGEIQVISQNMLLTADVETVSGAICLGLPENSGFTVLFNTVSGVFQSDFSVQSHKDTYVYGDGRANFDVETVSGELKIQVNS